MDEMNEKIFTGKDMLDALAYKQKLCHKEMHRRDSCTHGKKCHFAHSLEEMYFNENLAEKVRKYIRDKITEHKFNDRYEDDYKQDDNFRLQHELFEKKEEEIKYLKKLKKKLDDIKYINEMVLKSNNIMEKMMTKMKDDRISYMKELNTTVSNLEKNSEKIKQTFKNLEEKDFKNSTDARIQINSFRARSASPTTQVGNINIKRKRSDILDQELNEYHKRKV